MRSGVQHTLSPEAAAVFKLSLTLARRRLHSHLTPLHLAAALLTSPSSSLRLACLRSQPSNHHRALDLCLNVALNRLPASSHAPPSLSNALIAALKRAQAHQRRGLVEHQQQLQSQNCVLNIKIELDWLILSILDDPSVSRVMREAGFSSTLIKTNLEECKFINPNFLHAVYVPSGGLGLSHNNDISGKDEQDALTCCPECISNFEKEAAFKSTHHKILSSNTISKDKLDGSPQLPYWLKPHANKTLEKDDLVQLRRKYNKLCQSLHLRTQNHYNSSSYPRWRNENDVVSNSRTIPFPYNQPAAKVNQTASTLPRFRRQPSCNIEFDFSNASSKNQSLEPKFDSFKSMEGKEVKITLSLGNSIDHEKNAVCSVIRENVPWQSEKITLIVDALMLMDFKDDNEDRFLLIQGNDVVGKRRLAVGLAKSMFGSSDMLFRMNMRDNANYTVSENRKMLEMVLRSHEKIVVLVEDVDYADVEFVNFLMARQTKDSCRAIFVLTTDGDTSCNTKRDDVNFVIQMKLIVHTSKHGLRVINEDHKRKSDWDLPVIKSKNQRKNFEFDEVSSKGSSNSLDLNVKANDEEEGQFSPVSSDLTSDEITIEQHNSLMFLKKIKNRFVFNRYSDRDEEAREMFMSKFRRSFHEATDISCLDVDENVLEKVLEGCGFYLNSFFEQWLKDIFQKSLGIVGYGDRENVSVRLCLDGKKENCEKDGYMGTCLPRRIPVSFMG